jgi:ribonuclease HI
MNLSSAQKISLIDMTILKIYTDGSCHTPTRTGGYAGIFTLNNESSVHTISGQVVDTTSNRMELLAVLESWKYVEELALPYIQIDLYTDSEYVFKGYSSWLVKWKNQSWLTSKNSPVKNRDLWEAMIPLLKQKRLTLYWVKGHSDNRFNNEADKLSNKARLGID